MKVWAVGVVLFFGLAELYQWVHSLALPLPVYAVAGLMLALVSNAERWSHWVSPPSRQIAQPPTQQPVQASVPPPVAQPLTPESRPAERSISFTIHKPQG